VTSAPLGVGVIGLGVGEQHARAFASHPDCRVAALCDLEADKLAQAAAGLPSAKRYARAQDLIGDPEVQIVCIASQDDDHASQVIQALELGKHVFVEKPLCLLEDELRRISRAWRRAGNLRVSTNTVLRRSPRFRWLKNAIRSGRLGTVFCIEGDYVYGRLSKLASGWRGRIPEYSVTLGGGVHLIDLILWLSAQRPVEVTAYGSGLGSAGSGFNGKDLVLALLRFESGLLAKVSANFASVYPHFHGLIVHGTHGTFENLPTEVSSSAHLWESRDQGTPPAAVNEPYPAVSKGALIPAFVEAVFGRGEPDVTEEEMFACLATCLAIDRSVSEGGQQVRIDYQY
jgi:predicted dehydrogenase